LCGQLARAFMPRYMQALYACKRIGELGAQQMLLDTVAIREAFLAVPSMVGDDEEPVAIEAPMCVFVTLVRCVSHGDGVVLTDRFVKFVSREVPRVELLLKLVSTPKERFGERYPPSVDATVQQQHVCKCSSTARVRYSVKALWPEVSAPDLTRVMELRNMKSSEQREVLEYLGLSASSSGASGGVKNAFGMFRDAGNVLRAKK
jgi:hypothetical protein